MLGKRTLLLLLPLIAFGNGQGGAVRDWRFRRPPRFPPRVVPRPVYVARPTTFAPRPEITTEAQPHEPLSTPHWPSPTYAPIRGPTFNRRPHVVWSRPFIPSSPTQKPAVTVVVLPGSHSHAFPTTNRPYYVYPEKTTAKPVNIPLAHESEPLYSKPESEALNEPEVSSSSKPITVASELENPSSKPIEVEPALEDQAILQSSPKPELVSSVSESQPTVQPELQPTPHVIPGSVIKPSPEPQVEPKPVPEVEPSLEPNVESKPVPAVEPSSEPQVESKPEPQIEPKPESSPEPTPEVTSERLPDVSLAEPVPTPASELELEVSPSSKPVLDSESSSKPSIESVSKVTPGNSFIPDAAVPSESSHESSTPESFSTISEASSEPEFIHSNPIRLKYIPGIGNSRNPISATWSNPSWIYKPSKKPEHPNPWKPTPQPIFYLPSRTSTTQAKQEETTPPKPEPVSLPTARTPITLDVTALMDYQCREPNGYFAVPTECDVFVECKTNIARQINCPDGLHFNPKAVWPEYPCAYPSEVKCAAHYAKQAPKPTAECPRQYGYFPSPSGDCGQYIMCLEGRATKMSCPPGLAFNLKTTACDWPANVPSCNPDVFKGFSCPVPEIGENGKPSDVIYKYRYGKSCKNYIACQRGSPRLLSCDEGLSYDDASQSCVDDEFVKDCS